MRSSVPGRDRSQDFQRFLCGIDRDDAIATGFEKEGADGEHLFVVIYAEDRLLGAHAVSLLPEATLWWLAADGPADASAGLQAHPLVVFKRCPVARPSTALRRVMGLLLREERKTKERGSPVCSTGDQVHLSDERSCRTAGCERGLVP